MARKKKDDGREVAKESWRCGDCAHAEPVMRFNTLTIHGRKPTLGTCPFWSESKCVLLSQKSCKHFTKKAV